MKYKLLILLVLSMLLSGCYSYREINDLAITSALGIDKSEKGFKVSAQIVNTQKSNGPQNSGGNSSDFMLYTNEGETLQISFREILNESGKKLYINHLSLLVISEEVAKEGINNILDLFGRDNSFRKQVLFVISKGTAEEFLSNVTSSIPLNAENIKEILNNNEKFLGQTTAFTLEDLLNDFLSNKKELVIPTFNLNKIIDSSDELKDTNKENNLKFFSNSIFKDNKLIGYFSERENLGYNILMGNTIYPLFSIKCDDNDNYATFEFQNSNIKIENKKSSLNFDISFNSNSTLTELKCNIKIDDDKKIEMLEKELNKEMKVLLENTIKNVLKTYNSDVFGFRELIYKNDPKFYKKIKNTFYEKEINDLKINVKTNIKIKSHGNLIWSVNYE